MPTTNPPLSSDDLNEIQEEADSTTVSLSDADKQPIQSNVVASHGNPNHTHHKGPRCSTNKKTGTSEKQSLKRRGSSVSRVDVDFFDHDGVQQLTRTLTEMSNQNGQSRRSPSEDTETTLSTGENFDFEKTLRIIGKKCVVCLSSLTFHSSAHPRFDESEIKRRQLGVVFQNLRVIGLGSAASHKQTIASVLNPFNLIGAIHTMRHPPLRDILSDFNGVIRPGEMLRKLSFGFQIYHTRSFPRF